MWKINLLSIVFVFVALSAWAAPSSRPPYEFFEGDYDIVGSMPDDGASYTGRAKISVSGDGLGLTRIVNGKETAFRGNFEKTSVAESDILLFQDEEPDSLTLSCLHVSDPDNYPRLNCLWGQGKKKSLSPGLEAYFPVKERIPTPALASPPPAGPSVNKIRIGDPEIR